jgi:hypothetical protein
MFWRIDLPVFGGKWAVSSLLTKLRFKVTNMSLIALFNPISRSIKNSVFYDLIKLAKLGLGIKLFESERISEVIRDVETQ